MGGSFFPWLPGWVPNWSLYAAAVLLFLGGVWSTVHVVMGHRKRLPRSCPKCRYDMTRTTGLQCSECGHIAKSERTLHRRRGAVYRWALLATTLFLASIPVGLMPHTRIHGWLSVVPTPALPWLIPLQPDDQELRELLFFRLVHAAPPGPFGPHRPDVEDLANMISRLARGVPLARPPSSRWKGTSGNVLRQILPLFTRRNSDGTFSVSTLLIDRWGASGASTPPPSTSAALSAAVQELVDLPYISGEVLTRTVWPLNHPLVIDAPLSGYWPERHLSERLMSFSANDGPWSTPQRFYGTPTINFAGSESTSNPTTLRIRMEVIGRDGPDPAARVSLGAYERTLTLRFAKPGEVLITPVDDPKLTALLASGSVLVDRSSDLSIDLLNRYDGKPFAGTPFEGVALGGTLELLCDGKVVLIQRLRTALGSWHVTSTNAFPPDSGPRELEELLADARNNPSSPSPRHTWTARLRSDPDVALDIIDADRCWSGTLELPVEIVPN